MANLRANRDAGAGTQVVDDPETQSDKHHHNYARSQILLHAAAVRMLQGDHPADST
jgi:hypothetical protein